MASDTNYCYYLICDECPEETAEYGPHGDFLTEAVDNAVSDGWLVEGDEHICPQCVKQRKHAACAADGGHDMAKKGAFKNGAEVWECGSCGFWETTDQPTLEVLP